MDENTEVVDIIWQLDCPQEQIAQSLDCPTFAERSPAVDAAWEDYLGTERAFYAHAMTYSKRYNLDSPEWEKAREDWKHWNRSSELVRADHFDEPVIKLARNRGGFADEVFGRPTTNIGFSADDLWMYTPRIIAVLENDVPIEDQLDVDYDYLYKAIQKPRSAQELLSFAERVYQSHVELVGQESFDALIERRLEGLLRDRLFDYCIAQEAMDTLTETVHGYPMFEAVIVASSLVRWARFWGSHNAGVYVFQSQLPPEF